MSKLLVIVLIHSCLILKTSCYNEVEHVISDNWLASSDAPHKSYQEIPGEDVIDHTHHPMGGYNADAGQNECEGCKYYPVCGGYYRPIKEVKSLPTASRPTSDQSDWMAKYKERQLSDIVMPGSHHTGINDNPDPWTKWDIPQVMSVADQLKAGVRFMDIRVATAPSLSQPTIVRTFKYNSFEGLVRAVVKFLKTHQSEVVVLRLEDPHGKQLKWRLSWHKVDRILEDYAKYIHMEGNPMKMRLSELGGKLIICQERSNSDFKTLKCLGSVSKTTRNEPIELPSKMRRWLKAQKRQLKTFKFLEAICTPDQTDVSTSSVPGFKCKYDGKQLLKSYTSLKQLAADCNYKVYNWLKKNRRYISKNLNSVMTDFVNPKIMNYIINSN